jgi:hypothetical protein
MHKKMEHKGVYLPSTAKESMTLLYSGKTRQTPSARQVIALLHEIGASIRTRNSSWCKRRPVRLIECHSATEQENGEKDPSSQQERLSSSSTCEGDRREPQPVGVVHDEADWDAEVLLICEAVQSILSD